MDIQVDQASLNDVDLRGDIILYADRCVCN